MRKGCQEFNGLKDGKADSTNLKTESNIISTKKDTDNENPSFAVKAAYVELNDTTLFSDDLSFCSDRKSTFYKIDEKLVKYSVDGGENWTSVTPDISDSASACYYEHQGNAWISRYAEGRLLYFSQGAL